MEVILEIDTFTFWFGFLLGIGVTLLSLVVYYLCKKYRIICFRRNRLNILGNGHPFLSQQVNQVNSTNVSSANIKAKIGNDEDSEFIL